MKIFLIFLFLIFVFSCPDFKDRMYNVKCSSWFENHSLFLSLLGPGLLAENLLDLGRHKP
jgi:hypothetical protein